MREINKKTNPKQVGMVVIVAIIIVKISGKKISTKSQIISMTNGALGNLVVMMIQRMWNNYKHLAST